MSRRRGFFGTRGDLEPWLRAFESVAPAVYVMAGLFDSPEPRCFPSALDLGLGRAVTGAMASEDRYLLLVAGVEPRVRPVPQRSGGTKFAIDQQFNPDSVVCCFGGVHAGRVLISGEIGTIGASEISGEMFKLLARLLTRDFVHIGSYWVGPEAREMLQQGWRLTFSVRSPVEYDLAAGSG